MKRDVDPEIRAWLEAEAAGRADEADLRFRLVGRRLDRRGTPAGFTGAVMARLVVAHARQDAYARRWVRAAVAASVVLVGGAAAMVPWHGWVDGLLASVQLVAWGLGRLVVGGQAWLASGLALWRGLAEAAAVVGRQVAGPVPVGLLALNLAVALCALGALRRLMAPQEN